MEKEKNNTSQLAGVQNLAWGLKFGKKKEMNQNVKKKKCDKVS